MDQGSDDIRQTIDSTRAALDEKLDTLEHKARQTFDLNHQVSERPWLMLGAALAAGYVLGTMGDSDEPEQRWSGVPATTTDYNQHAQQAYNSNYNGSYNSGPSTTDKIKSTADSFLSQFDDEIDMLKTAAITTLTNFLRDSIKEVAPALGRQLDQTMRERGYDTSPSYGGSVSSAPGASHSELSGASKYYDVRESSSTVNHESIPETTYQQSNMADRDAEHATPYYPPGSSGNRERSIGDTTTY
jgi:hypothetical protein